MSRYLGTRLLQAVVAIVGILLVAFLLLHLIGDPVALLVPEGASLQDIEDLREALGLKDPLPIRFWRFLQGVSKGDFGRSLGHNEPALRIVLQRMPATAQLALVGVALSIALGIPLGVVAALRRRGMIGYLSEVIALLGQSVPSFWLGIMLILLFALRFPLFPTSGRGTWAHLILPALTIASFPLASIVRLVRSSMLEVLGQDYIRTARAKGIGERRVVYYHALRNASIPVVTYIGLQIGHLLGGAVVTETVFAWPGVGRLVVQAIYRRDYPLVQAAVFVLALIFVLVNLAVDLMYVYLNPRIRYG